MFKTRKNRSPIGTQNLHIAEIQEFEDDLPPMEEVERIRSQHPDAAMASVHSIDDAGRPGAEQDRGVSSAVTDRLELAKRYAAEVYEKMVGNENDETPEPRQTDQLVVGRNIRLQGNIEACGMLIVDGQIEATVKAEIFQVTKHGVFIGDADVETAEIAGRFEGNLTVRKKAIIRSTATVSGTLRYNDIEIEAGGHISGDVQVLPKEETVVDEPAEPDAVEAASPEPQPLPQPELPPRPEPQPHAHQEAPQQPDHSSQQVYHHQPATREVAYQLHNRPADSVPLNVVGAPDFDLGGDLR